MAKKAIPVARWNDATTGYLTAYIEADPERVEYQSSTPLYDDEGKRRPPGQVEKDLQDGIWDAYAARPQPPQELPVPPPFDETGAVLPLEAPPPPARPAKRGRRPGPRY